MRNMFFVCFVFDRRKGGSPSLFPEIFNCTYFPSTYLEDPRDELLGLLLFLSAKDGGGDRLTACEDSLTTGWAVVDRFSAVLFIEEDRF